jgi:hypothetical protein
MSIIRRRTTILVGAMLSCAALSFSASSRPWKPTPTQIAGDYASINHNKGNGEFVTIGWWAAPTAAPGTQLASLFEKYILISVTRSHLNSNKPANNNLSFDEIDRLETSDQAGNALTPVERDALPPASIGLLATFEAGYRQGLGPRGKGTKFFLFDAGSVRACEKGGISVPLDGETYTWETPFPGCLSGLRYGRLGVRIRQLTNDIAAALNLKPARGVMVADIDETGAAKPAGIHVGDIITKMDGKEINGVQDLPRIVAETPANKQVEVVIIHGGEERSISVMLGPEILQP